MLVTIPEFSLEGSSQWTNLDLAPTLVHPEDQSSGCPSGWEVHLLVDEHAPTGHVIMLGYQVGGT